MRNVVRDIRYGLRQLRRTPAFTATVVATVALGVAATTIVFSLVDGVLLKPLPFPQPDRLVALDTLGHPPNSNAPASLRMDTSYPNFFDWRSQSRSFQSMASYTTGGLTMSTAADAPAQRVPGTQVSADFFDTVGVAPALGRGFKREEERPGTRVVVLSHDTWQSVFQGDPHVLGRRLLLSDEPYTVVGVMPAGFTLPLDHPDTAFWITMARDAEGKSPSTEQRGYNQLSVVGRLRPGVTVAQARDELNTIQRGLAVRYPDEMKNENAAYVEPLRNDLVAEVRRPLKTLFGAVACLMLIVCVNVAGLLLSRMNARRGEFAVRLSLGATRWQIVRQLLAESLVLSLAGGLLGTAAAWEALRHIGRFLPEGLPRAAEIAPSPTVLWFSIAASVVTGLLFGVLPALRASGQDPALALGENSRGAISGRRHRRLQSSLVVFETAVSFMLLVAAGLLIRSFDRILRIDPGFSPEHTMTFRLSVPKARYDTGHTSLLSRNILDRLRSAPGVESATGAYPLPLTGQDIHITFRIPDRPTATGDEPSARVSVVEPGFFETLRIPLLRGRYFLSAENDAKAAPVIIVNDAFARRFFPGENPLGRHIASDLSVDGKSPSSEVVGVVGNVKRSQLTEDDIPEYYLPYEQAPVATPAFALRVSGDPARYAEQVRKIVSGIDSGVAVYRIGSYDSDLVRTRAQQRFQTILLTVFAASSLLLAMVGLYGLLSYMVSQRTKEFGLRLALGAQRTSLLEHVLLRGMTLTAAGLAAGLLIAIVVTRLLASQLYQVRPLDTLTLAGMVVVLLAACALASIIPGVRASRMDPMEALRNE